MFTGISKTYPRTSKSSWRNTTTGCVCTRHWAIERRKSLNARPLPAQSAMRRSWNISSRRKRQEQATEHAIRIREHDASPSRPCPGMHFPRHGGIYRSDVVLRRGRQTRERGVEAHPVGGRRDQRKGRDGKIAPCSSSAMSSGRLFLDRVACQQSPSPLHRQPDHKRWTARREGFIIER